MAFFIWRIYAFKYRTKLAKEMGLTSLLSFILLGRAVFTCVCDLYFSHSPVCDSSLSRVGYRARVGLEESDSHQEMRRRRESGTVD